MSEIERADSQAAHESPRNGRRFSSIGIAVFVGIVALAAVLRLASLGGEFLSEDDVRQTYRVIHMRGYWWLAAWGTGVASALLQKLSLAALGAVGVVTNEFWWRVPSAVTGVAQTALTYAFARKVGVAPRAALAATAVVAVLPVHVANSRYTWGHEISGLLVLTIALWALYAFFDKPRTPTALGASLASAAYLISHHYILPFFPAAVLLAAAAPRLRTKSLPSAWATGVWDLVRHGVWILPLLAWPIYEPSINYTTSKPTTFAFRWASHSWLFTEATGLFVALALACAVIANVLGVRRFSRIGLTFTLLGGCYLAPLVFGASNDFTNVKGYMMIGIWLLIIAAALVAAPLFERRARAARVMTTALVALTAWGTLSNVFETRLRGLPDPSFAKVEWGRALRDPGVKTAAYLVRQHVPVSTSLYFARSIGEWPAFYYFERTGCRRPDESFPHRTVDGESLCARYADVVVADANHLAWVRENSRLKEKVVITEGGVPVLWIYAVPQIEFPTSRAASEEYDKRYDENFTPRVHVGFDHGPIRTIPPGIPL